MGAPVSERRATGLVFAQRGKQISGAPRHRRDVVSVAASARWRGVSRPSTRRCRRDRVGSMAWRITELTGRFPHGLARIHGFVGALLALVGPMAWRSTKVHAIPTQDRTGTPSRSA